MRLRKKMVRNKLLFSTIVIGSFCLNIFLLSGVYAASYCSAHFSTSSVLDADSANDGYEELQPQLVTDGNGVWITAWQHQMDPTNILGGRIPSFVVLKRSIDNGSTWQDMQWISTDVNSNSVLPRLATNQQGEWVLVWVDAGIHVHGLTGDVFFSRSSDNGKTWSIPKRINSFAATDSRYFTVDAIDFGSHAWVISGTYQYQGVSSVYFFRSTDNGQTWIGPQYIDHSSGTSKEYVSMETSHAGQWVAAWSSYDPSNPFSDSKIMVSTSGNDGQSWNTPKELGFKERGRGWVGDLKYSRSSGFWVMVWYSGINLDDPTKNNVSNNIVYSYSHDNGTTWSTPAWLYGDVLNSTEDVNPRLYTDSTGSMCCAWYHTSNNSSGTIGTDAWIYQSCSPNYGVSWWAPSDLNRTMQLHVLIDQPPAMAMGNDTKVIAVWSTEHNADGSAGNLSNLFWSRTAIPGTEPVTGRLNSGISLLLLGDKK